ncbi:hypothetical protein JOD24_002749 [Kroppenstedtia sanguinis]|uniref:hypothetical protein n=1 Tax=Kroppenstedtia sanguinis TaxID=1380684 RepID=UPI003D19D26F
MIVETTGSQIRRETGLSCGFKKGKFIEPLDTLKLPEVSTESLTESLQMIYFKRTGTVNYEIDPNDYERNKFIDKNMGC